MRVWSEGEQRGRKNWLTEEPWRALEAVANAGGDNGAIVCQFSAFVSMPVRNVLCGC